MPARALDIAGKRFGRLTALRDLGPKPGQRRRLWEFRCACGNLHVTLATAVKGGGIHSCGCSRPAQAGLVVAEMYTYKSWTAMIRRCEDRKSKWYKDYGAKGVSVYFDWLGSGGFVNFIRDMGPRPFNKTLDRFPDCAGNYGPDNCRWATAREQRLNQARVWAVKNLKENMP